MEADSAYNYTASEEFVIENGILKGKERPYVIEHNSFGELILECLRASPDSIGEVDGMTGAKISFGEMMKKSVKCAMWLREQGLRTGDVVGICTHNQVDMYVPCFASLYLGAVFNPWWDADITKGLARYFVNFSKPRCIFVNEVSASVIADVVDEIDQEIKIIVFGGSPRFLSLDDIIESQKTRLLPSFRCAKLSSIDEPAVIMYTSGTTGPPKGALHSGRSLFGNTRFTCDMARIKDTVRSLTFSPLAWTTGMTAMLRSVLLCETRIIYPDFQEEKTLELIEKYKVNWMLLGPNMAQRLQHHLVASIRPKNDLSSLQFLWVTGKALPKATREKLASSLPNTKVLQSYGTTEIGGHVVVQNERSRIESCGNVIRNVSFKVVDSQSGKILGPGERGEGLFKSPYMMTYYLDNPGATGNTIDADGWLHTGDVMYYDESGEIYVTDRLSELIKYRGQHVSPAMIEKILLQHSDVTDTIVLGKSHEIDEAHPIAYVLKKPNSTVTKGALEELVAKALPDYMKLRGGVVFVDKMIYTRSGKIDRVGMRKLLRE